MEADGGDTSVHSYVRRSMRNHSKVVMETARNTHVKSKEQQRPVQRVPPMQTRQVPQHEMPVTPGAPSQPAARPQTTKMLIFLQNGEQRLITFTLLKDSCTLQEVLEQVNVPFSEDTHIQCMQNTGCLIDYFVSVGCTTKIEEMLENHPMLAGDLGTEHSKRLVRAPCTLPLCRRAPEVLRGLAPEALRGPAREVVRGRAPEALRGRAPEALRGRAPEVLRGPAPEVLRGPAPEVLRGPAPEVLHRRAPEVLRRRAAEVLRRRAPEVLRRRAPEVLRRRAPEALRISARASGAKRARVHPSLNGMTTLFRVF